MIYETHHRWYNTLLAFFFLLLILFTLNLFLKIVDEEIFFALLSTVGITLYNIFNSLISFHLKYQVYYTHLNLVTFIPYFSQKIPLDEIVHIRIVKHWNAPALSVKHQKGNQKGEVTLLFPGEIWQLLSYVKALKPGIVIQIDPAIAPHLPAIAHLFLSSRSTPQS
ncbi:MAG: hypothetical protein V2G48_06395 [bacterium JZ-2024 1]